MKQLTHKRRRGFSLLELVVVIGMIAVVTGILVRIFRASYESYGFSSANGELQLSTRGAIDRMTREMRQSVSVAASNGSYNTGSSAIVLQLASIQANETIIPSTYDYVIYRLDPSNPKKLQEIMVAASGSARKNDTRTILNNVDSASFTYYDVSGTAITSGYTATKRIRLQIDASQTKYGKNIPVSYSEQATLRNK
jgi:prepilin-type N-terminal cleavage/methylation domain-containing protein